MFYIIIVVFFCFIGSLFMYFDRNNPKRNSSDENEEAVIFNLGIVLNVVGAIFFLIGGIVNLSNYSGQKERFEEIRSEKQNLQILEKRFVDLRAEFTKNLGEKYPEMEKSIFEKMGPKDAEQLKMYFVQYPELKSATTLNYLVEQIKDIADDWFNKQLLLQTMYGEARYKRVSPWLVLKAEIPADLYPSIYQQ